MRAFVTSILTLRLAFSVVLALAMAFMPERLWAQPDGLTLEVTAGFDGYYRPGAWTPVFVTINNQPANGGNLDTIEDFVGQLMMVSAPLDEKGTPINFLRLIEVPRGSTNRRYIVYARFPEKLSAVPELHLNTDTGKFIAAYPLSLNAVPKSNLLFLNISDSIDAPQFPRLRGGLDPQLNAKLQPVYLAEHWAAYDSVDVMVFPGWPDAGVPAERVDAIREWVQMGGTLVFLGGQMTQSYKEEVAKSILPVEIEDTTSLQEVPGGFRIAPSNGDRPGDSDRSYVVARSYLKEGTEAILDQEGYPLLARQELGKGQIIFFATDLKSSSPAFERFLGPYWLALLPLPNIADTRYQFADVVGTLQTLTGRAARAPNQFILIILCFVYMFVVGPVNFALLGRQKKLEWAWFTVPAIVFVFFFLVYGFGRLTKGGESIVRELTIQEFDQAATLGRSTTITGTFVSSPGRYFVYPSDDRQVTGDPFRWHSVDPFSVSDYAGFGISPGVPGVRLGGDMPVISYDPRKGNIDISSWKMDIYDARTFIGRGPESAAGSIDGDLRWEGRTLQGTLTNNSGVDFERAWIAVGNDVVTLGTFRNGDSVSLREKGEFLSDRTEAARNRPGQYAPIRSRMEELITPRPEDDSDVNASNAAAMIRFLWSPPISGQFMPPRSGDVTFIGYRQEPAPKNFVTNLEPDVDSRAVVELVELRVEVPGGNRSFEVSDAFLQKRLLVYDPGTRGTFHMNNAGQLEMQGSAGVFVYELPFEDPRLVVDQIAFTPVADTRNNPKEDLVFEVFQYAPVAGWVAIEANRPQPNNNMALPVNGRMYIRVRCVENDKQDVNVGWDNTFRISNLGVNMQGSIK